MNFSHFRTSASSNTLLLIAYGQRSLFVLMVLLSIPLVLLLRRISAKAPTIAVGPNDIGFVASRICDSNSKFKLFLVSAPPNSPADGRKPWRARGARSKTSKFFRGPLLLWSIASSSNHVLYIGDDGFLMPNLDFREWEFRFLRSIGVKVSVLCTGSDVRSMEKHRQVMKEAGLTSLTEFLDEIIPNFNLKIEDQKVRLRVEVIDRCAEHIFNAPLDQISFFTRPTHDYLHFSMSQRRHDLAFFQMTPFRIVHAATRPALKGSAKIQDVIKALQDEGLRIEYSELSHVPHDQVLQEFSQAHIVIGQLHSLLPGQVGIEALESGAVLVTSAPWDRDPTLAKANELKPWVVVTEATFESTMRQLLNASPSDLLDQSFRGIRWLTEVCDAIQNTEELAKILTSASPCAICSRPDECLGE